MAIIWSNLESKWVDNWVPCSSIRWVSWVPCSSTLWVSCCTLSSRRSSAARRSLSSCNRISSLASNTTSLCARRASWRSNRASAAETRAVTAVPILLAAAIPWLYATDLEGGPGRIRRVTSAAPRRSIISSVFDDGVSLVIGAEEGAKEGAGADSVSRGGKTSCEYSLSRWSS